MFVLLNQRPTAVCGYRGGIAVCPHLGEQPPSLPPNDDQAPVCFYAWPEKQEKSDCVPAVIPPSDNEAAEAERFPGGPSGAPAAADQGPRELDWAIRALRDMVVNGNETGGVAFELQPPVTPGGAWKHVHLHQFAAGQLPGGSLAMDKNGGIFGVTVAPSNQDPSGTVYLLATKHQP